MHIVNILVTIGLPMLVGIPMSIYYLRAQATVARKDILPLRSELLRGPKPMPTSSLMVLVPLLMIIGMALIMGVLYGTGIYQSIAGIEAKLSMLLINSHA